MRGVVEYFVRRHFLVNVMVAVVVVLGLWTASTSQREGFPAVTINHLIVTAQLPGASAAEIERELSLPIEEAVEELEGIDTYHTQITDNLSVTTLEYDPDWSVDQLRVAEGDLRQALDRIRDFPDRMLDQPTIQRVEASKFPVLEIALAGPSDQLPEAATMLELALEEVEGISKVEIVGLEDPELGVLVDPVRARAHGVDLDTVMRAIERRNIASTGGILEQSSDRRQVVLDSRFHTPEEVGQTVVSVGTGGEIIRVDDLARVELTRRDQGLRVHTNGRPGISVVVRKQADADILTTVDAIKAATQGLEFPAEVEVFFVNDSSFMTRNRLALMANNGLIGLILVIAVLAVFLDRRAAIWVSVGVPVVLLGVVALLPLLGMTLNMIALGGFVVVLGMLVDDAVVVAERIVTRQGEGLGRGPRAAVAGVSDVMRPVIASAITTVLAFSPLFSIGGMAGKSAWSLPVVVILALILSLVESFLILPAHMSAEQDDAPPAGGEGNDAAPKAERPEGSQDPNSDGPRKGRGMLALERGYRQVLRLALRWRGLVLVLFAAGFMFVMGVLVPQMGVSLFPQDDSEALFITVNMPVGTPLEQTEAAVAAIEDQLPELVGEDLVAVTARIGHRDARAVDRVTGAAEHEAVISALFKPLDRDKTSAQWAVTLGQTLAIPEGARVLFEGKPVGPPLGSPVTLHVGSNEDELRRATAEAAASWLREQPGVVEIDIDERPGLPRIELDLDHDKLALRGLDATTVGRTLTAAFHGLEVSEHRDLDETTRFRVMLEPSARTDLDALLELPLHSRTGERVLLRDLVHPVEVQAVSRLHHRDGRRTATVTASFAPDSGLDVAGMATRIETELLPGLAEPGLRVEIGGEATESKKTTEAMGVAMGLAIFGILTVIALMFGSFLEAVFIISVIPFGAAGVMLAFFIHGKPLSMFALLGIIGLSGVVVNAAIVMVDAIRKRVSLSATDPSLDADEALTDAVVERLRPILVTTLTTCGGVLPTAYGLGGYDAMLSPMSLALGWGLIFATAITMFLVPCLYQVAQDMRGLVARVRARWRREQS